MQLSFPAKLDDNDDEEDEEEDEESQLALLRVVKKYDNAQSSMSHGASEG